MRCQQLTDWANILVDHEYNSDMPRIWRWVAGLARTALDGVADIVEGRWPVGRYRDEIAEDDAVMLLRAKGWLVMPPELKSRVELRFLDEMLPATASLAA